jgi:hypothetical protein
MCNRSQKIFRFFAGKRKGRVTERKAEEVFPLPLFPKNPKDSLPRRQKATALGRDVVPPGC